MKFINQAKSSSILKKGFLVQEDSIIYEKQEPDEPQREFECKSPKRQSEKKSSLKQMVSPDILKKISSKDVAHKVFNFSGSNFQPPKLKKPSIKYNLPELDLNNHIKQMRIINENQKCKDQEKNENINMANNTTDLNKKTTNIEGQLNTNEDDPSESLDKRMKIFSKFSDLVIGERMTQNQKIELGIIPRKRNQNFKKKGDDDFIKIPNKKIHQNKSSIQKSTSLIKFTPKNKYKLDITDENYEYLNKKANKQSNVKEEFYVVNTAKNKNSNYMRQLINLNTPSNLGDDNKAHTDPKNKKERRNLAVMVKEQFNKIKISNLMEPEKIKESTQDIFVRNKTEYVMEFQQLNREIGKYKNSYIYIYILQKKKDSIILKTF